MLKGQVRRVQRLAFEAAQNTDQLVGSASRQCQSTSIDRVADQRMTPVSEVNPYLVRSAGLELHLN